MRRVKANQPVRRPPRRIGLWLGRGAAALAVVGVLAGGVQVWRNGSLPMLGEWVGEALLQATAAVGFSVEEVMVTGRVRTESADILAALNLESGDPILTFDPEAARAALEALPWVEHAVVERRLPDSIHVRLQERRPLALWQHDQRLRLVDQQGRVLQEGRLADFADLPMIVGEDAPAEAPALLVLLQAVPAVAERVQSAVRIGGRRWDLHLDNGVNVRLPEAEAGRALLRLAELQVADSLFDRDILSIDLRLADRLVVETSPIAAERRRLPEENT